MANALVEDGFISEMFEACNREAQSGLKFVEIPEEDAVRMIRTWLLVKKQLEQQGYTVTWYNRLKNTVKDN